MDGTVRGSWSLLAGYGGRIVEVVEMLDAEELSLVEVWLKESVRERMSLDVGGEYGGGAAILFCCRQSMSKLNDIAVYQLLYIYYIFQQ